MDEDDNQPDEMTMDEYDEVELRPEKYIHNSITKCQEAMNMPGDMKENIIRYKINVEMLESICDNLKVIDDNYKRDLMEYINSLGTEISVSGKDAKISNWKFGRLCKYIFQSRTIKGTLRF